MKRYLILLPLALLCAAWGASKIRWTTSLGVPFTELRIVGHPTIQFGLRDDGVVVWREITNATNSPAEKNDYGIWMYNGSTNNQILLYNSYSNVWMTP